MQELESGKIINHINEAKLWLDEAENEFRRANPIRGELILNLAQAEIKYAWELSRKSSVSIPDKALPRSKPVFWLPVAASIILIPMAAMILWYFTDKAGGSGASTHSIADIQVIKPGIESRKSRTNPTKNQTSGPQVLAVSELPVNNRPVPSVVAPTIDRNVSGNSGTDQFDDDNTTGHNNGSLIADDRPVSSAVPVDVTAVASSNLLDQDSPGVRESQNTGLLLTDDTSQNKTVPGSSVTQPVSTLEHGEKTTVRDSTGDPRINP